MLEVQNCILQEEESLLNLLEVKSESTSKPFWMIPLRDSFNLQSCDWIAEDRESQ